jgi:hypothetical protein
LDAISDPIWQRQRFVFTEPFLDSLSNADDDPVCWGFCERHSDFILDAIVHFKRDLDSDHDASADTIANEHGNWDHVEHRHVVSHTIFHV